MNAIIKKAQHRGKAPFLSVLAAYLAAEDGREACLLMNAAGERIEPEDLVQAFGGDRAEHWHAIVSPTPEDCRVLAERHGGDYQAAALSQGKAMAQRLERDTGQRVAFAVHFEERAGQPHFHYHFVGMGEAKVRLYGRSGVIQRAWDRTWEPDRKPIVDWKAHAAFLKTRQELRAVQKQMRDLGQERYRELKAAPPDQKASIREAFKTRELDLIPQRYELEVRAIHHRYAAREDVGSPRHQAELVEALNRRTGAITRAERRGLPWEVLKGERSGAWGGGLARSATRTVRSTAATVTREATGTVRKVAASLTAGSGAASLSPAPIVQPSEAALSAAKAAAVMATRIAARAATEVALKAASVNPPGLAIQAALLAAKVPGKLLDVALPVRGKVPDELALPLRVASAAPGLGIPAKVAAVVTEATLKPLQKETER